MRRDPQPISRFARREFKLAGPPPRAALE